MQLLEHTHFSQENLQFDHRGRKGAQNEHAHRSYGNQSADICKITVLCIKHNRVQNQKQSNKNDLDKQKLHLKPSPTMGCIAFVNFSLKRPSPPCW